MGKNINEGSLLLPVNWYYKAPSVKVNNRQSGHLVERSTKGVQGGHIMPAMVWRPLGYWSWEESPQVKADQES